MKYIQFNHLVLHTSFLRQVSFLCNRLTGNLNRKRFYWVSLNGFHLYLASFIQEWLLVNRHTCSLMRKKIKLSQLLVNQKVCKSLSEFIFLQLMKLILPTEVSPGWKVSLKPHDPCQQLELQQTGTLSGYNFHVSETVADMINHLITHFSSVSIPTSNCATSLVSLFAGNYLPHGPK